MADELHFTRIHCQDYARDISRPQPVAILLPSSPREEKVQPGCCSLQRTATGGAALFALLLSLPGREKAGEGIDDAATDQARTHEQKCEPTPRRIPLTQHEYKPCLNAPRSTWSPPP